MNHAELHEDLALGARITPPKPDFLERFLELAFGFGSLAKTHQHDAENPPGARSTALGDPSSLIERPPSMRERLSEATHPRKHQRQQSAMIEDLDGIMRLYTKQDLKGGLELTRANEPFDVLGSGGLETGWGGAGGRHAGIRSRVPQSYP